MSVIQSRKELFEDIGVKPLENEQGGTTGLGVGGQFAIPFL